MIVSATLSGPLPRLGVIALALLVAGCVLAGGDRARATAMLGALVMAPLLLVLDIWHSPQLAIVHRHPAVVVVAAIAGVAAIAAIAWVLARRPSLVAPLVIATLPFRVPISAGGSTSNLLVPLYLVVGAGSLAFAISALRGSAGAEQMSYVADSRWSLWLQRLIALSVVLYALQALYSRDFEKALQQMVFFYVPFALMFCLLRTVRWNRLLLRRCLELVAVLAVLFAVVGFVEYATKTIILNPKLVVQNDLHAYFTVNSVFFDPDIFGRFLAIVMIMLTAALLYTRRTRAQLALTVVLAGLWAGLVLTLSRSSLATLVLGLGVLAALRWRAWRTTVAIGVAVIALGAVAVLASPKTFGLNQGLNGASSGRANLVTGGIRMFGERPLQGYGSGSFVKQYRRENPLSSTLAASHTIAVTIAAEQGIVGEIVYIALMIAAVMTLVPGARGDPARAAIAAAFVALILHTNLYADFLEDPITWSLLGIGSALAYARASGTVAERAPELVGTAA